MPVIRVRHDFDPTTMPCVWCDPRAAGLAWRAFLTQRWTQDLTALAHAHGAAVDVSVEPPERHASRPRRQAEITVRGTAPMVDVVREAVGRALTPEARVFVAFLAAANRTPFATDLRGER